MAGKGGGAWKVAYADFVTAMMAFFLVMWICSQDQKIKRAVADYFGHPLAVKQGTSKEPYRRGSVFENLTTGSVPQAESVSIGRGRDSYSTIQKAGRTTKIVSDWLFQNEEAYRQWKARVEVLREPDAAGSDPGGKKERLRSAVLRLADEMKSHISWDAARDLKGVTRDLLDEAPSQVNWVEIAEDLVAP